MSRKPLLHSICVAEFDELKGNTLSYRYPENAEPIQSHSPEAIAELCLPDGGHKHESDSIYILLTGANDIPLYGYAYFRNRKDSNEKRGARQLALLVIARLPYFDRFRPFLAVAIEQYLDHHESKAVIHSLHFALETSHRKTKQLADSKRKSNDVVDDGYTDSDAEISNSLANLDHSFNEPAFGESQSFSPQSTGSSFEQVIDPSKKGRFFGKQEDAGVLSNSTYTLQLWGKMFVMQPLNTLSPNEFGGASLKDLVLRFRIQTMSLWASLVCLKRVLVCGPESTAETVGNIVLATPLLLGPLGALIVPNLVPYVTLADVEPVTQHSSYVCGTTNGLFATKEQWYDVLLDPSSNKISPGPKSMFDRSFFKVQGNDLSFINRVLEGIEHGRRGEDWIRYEFTTFTQDFLDTVRELETERVNKRAKQNNANLSFQDTRESFQDARGGSTLSQPLPYLREQDIPQHIDSPSSMKPLTRYGAARIFNHRHTSSNHATQVSTSNMVNVSPISSQSQDLCSSSSRQQERSKKPSQKWPSKISPFLKRKTTKSSSDVIASTFAGSPLWLRYRWMQLNPDSFQPTRKRLSRIHAIAIKQVDGLTEPPAPPRRPDGWHSGNTLQLNPSHVSRLKSSVENFNTCNQPMDHRQENLSDFTTSTKISTYANQPSQCLLSPLKEESIHSVSQSNGEPSAEKVEREMEPTCEETTIQTSPISIGRWRTAKTPDGSLYYWHMDTKETRWSLPRDEIESYEEIPSPRSEVSSTSESRIEECTSPCAAKTSQERSTSDPVHDTANKWVMTNGRWQRVSVMVQDDLFMKTKKKTDWVEAFTEHGEPYWWNVTTGETRWEL